MNGLGSILGWHGCADSTLLEFIFFFFLQVWEENVVHYKLSSLLKTAFDE
jgi:hypothetical protein